MKEKNNKVVIISLLIVILVLIGAIVYMFVNGNFTANKANKTEVSRDFDKITKFNYYSGSSGHAIEFSGTRDDELINIDFKEYDGAKQNVDSYTITFEEFKNLLNKTAVDDCNKHTYDYQCGDNDGCSFSSFYVYYKDSSEENVCYKINDSISSFFKNMIDSEDNNGKVNEQEKDEELEEDTKEIPVKDKDEIKELDLTKCLNNKNSSYIYSNAVDVDANLMFYLKINSDKKSAVFSIDWEKFGPNSGASTWSSDTKHYQITGFSKNIESTFIGGVGQSVQGTTLFYLMEDGTVEYTPLFVEKFDSNNTLYYEFNYSYDYSSDGKLSNEHFETEGMVEGVKEVIKLYSVDVDMVNGSGWSTVIGATKDGSFYDLGEIINKN